MSSSPTPALRCGGTWARPPPLLGAGWTAVFAERCGEGAANEGRMEGDPALEPGDDAQG